VNISHNLFYKQVKNDQQAWEEIKKNCGKAWLCESDNGKRIVADQSDIVKMSKEWVKVADPTQLQVESRYVVRIQAKAPFPRAHVFNCSNAVWDIVPLSSHNPISSYRSLSCFGVWLRLSSGYQREMKLQPFQAEINAKVVIGKSLSMIKSLSRANFVVEKADDGSRALLPSRSCGRH